MSELESRELRDNILDGTNSELAFVQNGKLVKVKATNI